MKFVNPKPIKTNSNARPQRAKNSKAHKGSRLTKHSSAQKPRSPPMMRSQHAAPVIRFQDGLMHETKTGRVFDKSWNRRWPCKMCKEPKTKKAFLNMDPSQHCNKCNRSLRASSKKQMSSNRQASKNFSKASPQVKVTDNSGRELEGFGTGFDKEDQAMAMEVDAEHLSDEQAWDIEIEDPSGSVILPKTPESTREVIGQSALKPVQKRQSPVPSNQDGKFMNNLLRNLGRAQGEERRVIETDPSTVLQRADHSQYAKIMEDKQDWLRERDELKKEIDQLRGSQNLQSRLLEKSERFQYDLEATVKILQEENRRLLCEKKANWLQIRNANSYAVLEGVQRKSILKDQGDLGRETEYLDEESLEIIDGPDLLHQQQRSKNRSIKQLGSPVVSKKDGKQILQPMVERRATQKGQIMAELKKMESGLARFEEIIKPALEGAKAMKFTCLQSRIAFTDGWKMCLSQYNTPRDLYRFLREKGLEVKMPVTVGSGNYMWVQLVDGPQILPSVLEQLNRSVTDARQKHDNRYQNLRKNIDIPDTWECNHIKQFDVTRDFSGFFYAPDGWQKHWEALRVALEKSLACKLHNNGNSFASCFQFQEKQTDERIYIRVKVYNKGVALLQSETSQKTLGMNTKAIFTPSFWNERVLEETRELGWMRIEISHYVSRPESENQFWDGQWLQKACLKLEKVLQALNSIEGICYHVPMIYLLRVWQEGVKSHQVFIQYPDVCALFFSKNDKRGSYTGFFQDISKTNSFNVVSWLAARALAGPNSIIRCVMRGQGESGPTKRCIYEKITNISEIPGFKYGPEAVVGQLLPPNWSEISLKKTMVNSIEIHQRTTGSLIESGTNPILNTTASIKNPLWQDFVQYCKEHNISSISELQKPPDIIARMLNNKSFRQKMLVFLKHRRSDNRQALQQVPQTDDVGKHLVPQERLATGLTHPETVKILKMQLKNHQKLFGRALDAGGGDGRLTRDVFSHMFQVIDLFDANKTGVKIVKQMKQTNQKLDRIEHETFSSWKWRDSYDAIFLCWSAGYIPDDSLVAWLGTASAHLNKPKRRGASPTGFIWIFDNIVPEGEGDTERNQRLRPIGRLRSVFKAAGLTVHYQSPELTLHVDFGATILWALY